MSDAPVTPLETTTATPAPGPKKEGGEGVTLSRAEYDELQAARTKAASLGDKVKDLESAWEATQNLVRTDTPPEVRERSIRQVLSRAGYPAETIEQYVSGAMGDDPETPPPGDDTPSPRDRDMYEMRARIERQEEDLRRERATRLRNSMHEQVDLAINGELSKKLSHARARYKEAFPTVDEQGRLEVWRKRLMAEAMDRLRDRRAKEGEFRESWILDEVRAAGDTIADELARVIGDPDAIGRAPETAAGEDRLAQTKPVDPPKYAPGMTPEHAGQQLREYNVDAFLRLARDLDKGGTTKA